MFLFHYTIVTVLLLIMVAGDAIVLMIFKIQLFLDIAAIWTILLHS